MSKRGHRQKWCHRAVAHGLVYCSPNVDKNGDRLCTSNFSGKFIYPMAVLQSSDSIFAMSAERDPVCCGDPFWDAKSIAKLFILAAVKAY